MAASEASSPEIQPSAMPSPVAWVDRRSWVAVIAALAIVAIGSTWFGFLDDADGMQSVKLGVSLILSVIGLGAVLSVRLLRDRSGGIGSDIVKTTVALFSMTAALIHFAVVAQHFAEFWLYGWFFVLVGIAQLGWAPLIIVQQSRRVLATGAVLNGAIAITWGITRTYGAIIGPDATEPARAGFGDVASSVLEVLIVVGAIVLWIQRGREEHIRTETADIVSGIVALTVVPATVLGLYSAVAGQPFVSHVG